METLNIKEKRAHLLELSSKVRPLVEAGEFKNVNEAILLKVYTHDGNNEFKTYDQWKRDGFQVNKGAQAFYIWGKPLSKQQEEQGIEANPEGRQFFPLCFLFSNKQVKPIGEK